MNKVTKWARLGVFAIGFASLGTAAQAATLPSFPGAEGFGAVATGGRGGRVIKVTTLKANGPGSLQEALDAPGPRTIVFGVSGVVDGTIRVSHGDVTIAGQTAPGAGITIAGQLFLYSDYDQGADNVIIRHVRIRPPKPPKGTRIEQYDAVQGGQNTTQLILDHVSACCGADETVDLYTSDQVTVQWSTIEESAQENHPDGHAHNYGFIQGPDEGGRLSLHHNLFTGHKARCPAVANGPAEIVNNVIYNVRHGFIHNNPASGSFNIVGNVFKQGPNDSLIPFYFDGGARARYFLGDNFVDDPGQFTGVADDPWQVAPDYFADIDPSGGVHARLTSTLFDFGAEAGHVPVTTQPHAAAYELVLNGAGGFPRDVVTNRVVADTRGRTGSWGAKYAANAIEGLTATVAPADADNDGIADDWEAMHGLDAGNPADNIRPLASGYTAIEEYINELADRAAPAAR
jgi:pectate lyase